MVSGWRSCSFLLVCVSLRAISGVRLDDVESQTDECVDQTRAVFRSVSYRDLFRPMFEGTYEIRNRYTGKYLAAFDTIAATSLHHVEASKSFEWSFDRVDLPGEPVYTVKNRESGMYLIAKGSEVTLGRDFGHVGVWKLVLSEDGIHHSLQIASSDVRSLTDDGEDHAVSMMTDEQDAAKIHMSDWFFDQQHSFLPKLKIGKKREDSKLPFSVENAMSYKNQWEQAGGIPLWQGTEYTWVQACKDAKIDCSVAYANRRATYLTLGRTSEGSRRVVQENHVKSSCEAPLDIIRLMTAYNTKAVQEMRKTAGPTCAGQSDGQYAKLAQQAVEEECFASCKADIKAVMEVHGCKKPDRDQFIHDFMSGGNCFHIAPESAIELAEFTFQEHCLTWHIPNFLALNDRKGHTRAVSDAPAVCLVDKSSWRSKDIVQQGTCPSGTTCQCPRLWIADKNTTTDLAKNENVFMDGPKSVKAAILKNFQDMKRAPITALRRGITLQAAVLDMPILPSTFETIKFTYSALTWRCADTVGCWPKDPEQQKTEQTKKACRLPEEAKTGLSRTWFLPPAGVMIYRVKWYRRLLRRCKFRACDAQDMWTERIGFGPSPTDKTNVYNCQPLAYEDMTSEMQKKYIARIRETLPTEYANEL